MLIVIPTYKRNHCLKWVLQSLVQCKTDNIFEPVRVLVVNNYPPAREQIKNIVASFVHEKRFSWDVLCREKTLSAVENWYSAISDRALEGEVVFLNSDDDLFYPWSLEYRFEAITNFEADLLLAQIDGYLYFSKQATMVYQPLAFPNVDNVTASLLGYGQIYSYSPQAVSNHCYRNTNQFRAGLTKAMAWCQAQDWLDFNNQTQFITLYLPYAILLNGGKVAGLNKKCIILAKDIEEMRESKYGIPIANHGFMHLCALGVLNNEELGPLRELDLIRKDYSDEFLNWFLTCLFDKRVGMRKAISTLKKVGFPLRHFFSPRVLCGFDLIFRDLLGLNVFRLKKKCILGSVPAEKFLESLGSLP
jgi:hypothetical protein